MPLTGATSSSFFGKAAPTTSPRLLVGAAPSEEAAKMQEEADFGHTRPAKKTGTKKEAEQHGSRTSSTSSSTNTRDSVCIPSFTSSTVYCLQRKFEFSYLVTRSANLAKQGSKRYSYRASDTWPVVSGARKPLPIELGSNYPRRVGVTNNNRLQDRIPAETQEASSDCLHREGKRVHAGRDPEHARQTSHL